MKLNLKIEFKTILLIAIVIFSGLNYAYYSKIFKKYLNEIIRLKKEYNRNIEMININIQNFNKNINIFNKLKIAKRELYLKRLEFNLLKNKAKTKEDILSIIKILILESKIDLEELNFTGKTKIKNNMEAINFQFKGSAKLKNFIEFLDMIENKNDILIIDSYILTPKKNKKDEFNFNIKLKSIYLALND